MRYPLCLSALILSAALSSAAPPKLDIPADLKPSGQYVIHVPETDAVAVTYVGLSGIDSLPSVVLDNKRAFVLDVYGKPAAVYKFAAVAAGANGEQTRKDFTVTIGTPPVVPPPTVPPTEPPVNPPPTSGKLYFLIVRPDGPADPAFTAYMGNPGWDELLKKGHLFKDKTLTEAAAMGVKLPDGVTLPAVLTLRVRPDGTKSDIVRGPTPLPAPGEIVRLPEGVK